MTPDSTKWLLEHAAAAYEAEIESTDKIRERVGFLLSLAITPCLGIAAYLASNLRGNISSSENIVLFWVPLSFSMAILFVAFCYLAYVLLGGFKYSRVPSPSQILSFFEQHPDQDSVLQDGHSGLLSEYAESVDHNFRQNEHRKSKLLTAQRLAFGSFAILILCIPRWAYNFTHNEQRAQPVRIVSPIQILKEQQMSDEKKPNPPVSQQTNQSQQPAVTPTTTQQAKPAFPKSTMTMDSVSADKSKPAFPKSSLSLESFDPKAGTSKSGK